MGQTPLKREKASLNFIVSTLFHFSCALNSIEKGSKILSFFHVDPGLKRVGIGQNVMLFFIMSQECVCGVRIYVKIFSWFAVTQKSRRIKSTATQGSYVRALNAFTSEFSKLNFTFLSIYFVISFLPIDNIFVFISSNLLLSFY